MRILIPFALALCGYASGYSSCDGQDEAPPQSQSSSSSESSTPVAGTGTAQEQEPPGGKRVFGVLPNYRTADASLEGTVLPAKQKFYIAAKDSFDYPLVLLSG